MNKERQELKWESILLHSRHSSDNENVGAFTRSRIHPFANDRRGRIVTIWDTNLGRLEGIASRAVDGGNVSPPQLIHIEESCYRPQLTGNGQEIFLAAWQSCKADGWNIQGCFLEGDSWLKPFLISEITGNHMNVTLHSVGEVTAAAWECHQSSNSSIELKLYQNHNWTSQFTVSGKLNECYRPAIAVAENGDVHVVWDAYQDKQYSVYTRSRINGEWTDIIRLSSTRDREFKPSICIDGNGHIWVAWVHVQYVTCRGIIDTLSTVRCARMRNGEWSPISGSNTKDYVAHLAYGLLLENPSLGKNHGGYVGHRRHPMLTSDSRGNPWVLWERKWDSEEGYDVSGGVLCGRRFEEDHWSEEVILHKGHLVYSISNNLMNEKNRLWLTTRGTAQADFLKDLYLLSTDWPEPEFCERFNVDESLWSDWKPIDLPVQNSNQPSRHSIDIRGQKYDLYWIDLHCHSCITGGESGEPDELYHFARDHALLDAFCLTDSDTFSGYVMPTNNSAWYLTQHNSATFHDPGNFITFSAYEWDKNINYETFQTDYSTQTGKKAPISHSNHHNVYQLTDDGPLFRCDEPASFDMEGFRRCLEATNSFSIAHHQQWIFSDSENEQNVELCASWKCMKDTEWLHDNLNSGKHIGFVGMGDTHQRNPGFSGALTGIYLQELTRESIANALTARRNYATNGSRIIIEFRIFDAFMGECCIVKKSPQLSIYTQITRPPLTIELYRDGELIHQHHDPNSKCTFQYDDNECPKGEHFYYVKIIQQGECPEYPYAIQNAQGPWGWSSPIFVTKE